MFLILLKKLRQTVSKVTKHTFNVRTKFVLLLFEV